MIVRRVTLSSQQSWRCDLASVVEIIDQHAIRPPAVILVGEVVAAQKSQNWFTSRPLFGQSVLVTRPHGQATGMCEELAEYGADVLLQPAITITPPESWTLVDDVLSRLADFNWIVFSSGNGVHGFLERLLATGRDSRHLAHARLATIGPATTATLREWGLHSDYQPPVYQGEALADGLAGQGRNETFLLVRASRGRDVLPQGLAAAGHRVEQVVVYDSRDVVTPDADIAARMAAGEIHWTTLTSPAIARATVAMFGKDLHRTRLAAISPVTAGTLRELGFEPVVVATEFTAAGLVSALCAAAS